MTPAAKPVTGLGKRLDASRPAQQEIWDRFARDRDKIAEATRYLVALALSLSPEAMGRMAEHRGIPAASLTGEQQALLAQAEPLMRELGFLGRSAERRLGESTIEVLANGHFQFTWPADEAGGGLGINWLPYSLCRRSVSGSLAEVQEEWRDSGEWLIAQHYRDRRGGPAGRQ